MRIHVRAHGFDLTNHTRSYAESRLQAALSRFRQHITSVTVSLYAGPPFAPADAARCEIAIALAPKGYVHAETEHEWMHVAIERAAASIVSAVDRAVARIRTRSSRALSGLDRRARFTARSEAPTSDRADQRIPIAGG
jgi:ribosomal subunit interface protein